MQQHADLVIVGAGQAALTLADTLRRNGDTRSIVLQGEEPVPPYQRPPLSKAYLLGDMARDRLWLKPEQWYQEHAIGLQTNTRVARIDRDAACVVLQDGARIAYKQLVLATGSRPRPFRAEHGGDLPGVCTIRSMADIDTLRPALDRATNVVVIGGGYIGLESAAILRKLEREVALVEAGPRILARVAGAQTADMLRDLHLAHGVAIHEAVGVSALLPGADGRLAGVLLTDGCRLDADLAIVGIGALANDALARHSGLPCWDAPAGGVLVDKFCRTADASIHAIGDVAAFELQGQITRLESVQNACDQARALAQTLMGTRTAYAPVPWFWSDQYDKKLQMVGLQAGADQSVFRPGKRDGTGSVWYFRAGGLIAVEAVSDPRAYMTGKAYLEQGIAISADQILIEDHKTTITA